MNIAEAQQIAWQTAEDKGFHDDLKHESVRTATLLRLCLIHTEVSEAAQEVKRHWGNKCLGTSSFAEELADIVIRVMDLAGSTFIDLETEVIKKLEANKERPHLYGTSGQGGI